MVLSIYFHSCIDGCNIQMNLKSMSVAVVKITQINLSQAVWYKAAAAEWILFSVSSVSAFSVWDLGRCDGKQTAEWLLDTEMILDICTVWNRPWPHAQYCGCGFWWLLCNIISYSIDTILWYNLDTKQNLFVMDPLWQGPGMIYLLVTRFILHTARNKVPCFFVVFCSLGIQAASH